MQSLEGPHFLGSPHLNAKEAWLPGSPSLTESPRGKAAAFHTTLQLCPSKVLFPTLGNRMPQAPASQGRRHGSLGAWPLCRLWGKRGNGGGLA